MDPILFCLTVCLVAAILNALLNALTDSICNGLADATSNTSADAAYNAYANAVKSALADTKFEAEFKAAYNTALAARSAAVDDYAAGVKKLDNDPLFKDPRNFYSGAAHDAEFSKAQADYMTSCGKAARHAANSVVEVKGAAAFLRIEADGFNAQSKAVREATFAYCKQMEADPRAEAPKIYAAKIKAAEIEADKIKAAYYQID
ncbi:hypothetical protein MMC28_003813 [Mycoblastus sanguinarius]|nr:hypothetical protein [Mycoblastus sanguinarius]